MLSTRLGYGLPAACAAALALDLADDDSFLGFGRSAGRGLSQGAFTLPPALKAILLPTILAVPFVAVDYKLTKKFKLNLSFSGVQQINDKPLNYQVLLGAKAFL